MVVVDSYIDWRASTLTTRGENVQLLTSIPCTGADTIDVRTIFPPTRPKLPVTKAGSRSDNPKNLALRYCTPSTPLIMTQGKVIHCKTAEEYYEALRGAENRLVVVDCYADW